MAYTIYLLISKWKKIGTLKWLLVIPCVGLSQLVFSTIVGPILIGSQDGMKAKELMTERIQTQNLIFISLYGIIEYYAIGNFLYKNIISNLSKSLIKRCLNMTVLIALAFLISVPANDIYIQKFITAILSFQLIFFSIYLLIDLMFRNEYFQFEKHPIFIITAAIFILFSSTCPVYYLSGYFAINFTEASNVLNLTILGSYIFFYSTIIYTVKWIIA